MMTETKETKPFFQIVLENLAQLIFEELDPGFDLLMMERVHKIGCFLDYLHGVYLIQYVWGKGPLIDYEHVVEVIQDSDLTYDELNFLYS